jgi:hypothetical protein
MKKEKRKSAGQISAELLQKKHEKIPIIEQSEAMLDEYWKNLVQAVDRGYKKYQGNFYIHVETKKEPLFYHTFRNYFIDRKSCPTPNYDQSVFRYNRQLGQIEYLWTIPSRDTCFHLKENALIVAPQERQLLDFILKFDDGTLFKLCKKFNGEQLDSPLLEN